MSEGSLGQIVRVVGPTVDVKFESGFLPSIQNALTCQVSGKVLYLEVAQQLGEGIVRAVAMDTTDGLVIAVLICVYLSDSLRG